MKRFLTVVGIGMLLLLVLTVAVSGDNPVSGSKIKAKTNIEQKTVDVEIPTVSIQEAAIVQQPTGTDAYQIPWQSINGGGGDLQSDNYQMLSSIGQSVIGTASSDNYQTGIGYWYGAGGDGGGCFCGGAFPTFGDITCDQQVNPVDVVQMVNFVYKNIDNRCPPPPHDTQGWNCPSPPGDVTCDTEVNPVDVVRYVNYVYKNITPFPCDPCE